MNRIDLMGRLTRDAEVRATGEGSKVAKFSIAVPRRFKRDEADFLNCVAFGKTADFVEKYLKKGTKVVVGGRVQTGSYTKQDGTKVYTTDVVVEEVEFAESKQSGEVEITTDLRTFAEDNGFISVPDNVDDDGLPFN